MADCKKCLHAPVCEKLPKMPGAMVAECDDLKDRTKWVERPKGRWVMTLYATTSKRGRVISNKKFACSECGYGNGRKQSNFCPNCGADMRGESDGT